MNVKITGTKHNLLCLDCKRRWGVYLDENNRLPVGWDICIKCASTLDKQPMKYNSVLNSTNSKGETEYEIY